MCFGFQVSFALFIVRLVPLGFMSVFNGSAHILLDGLGLSCLREDRRLDAGLDDSCVDGQNGEDDTSQKHQGQLVDILYSDKDHCGHRGQQDGAIHAHVVE